MTNQFPVPQDAVELGLLASVSQDMANWLQVAAFEEDDFVTNRQVFKFMKDYLAEYGGLPSSTQISTRFAWSPPVGDFLYWLREMKRYSMARHVMDAMKVAYDHIGEPDKAAENLLTRLALLKSSQTNHMNSYDSSGAKRLELFDSRTQNIFHTNSIVGLRTGLKIIDDSHIGYLPGSLVGCYARPGVGKTWWLLWSGMHTWEDGGTVLCISPEMPANMLDLRIDTLAGEVLRHNIDYGKLITGDPSIRTEYEYITQVMSQSERWWTYDSLNDRALSVDDIAGLIRRHSPDIVLVDGISLLRPRHPNQPGWEQVKDSIYELKNQATINENAILVTTQAVNSARGRRTEVQSSGRGDDFIMPSLNDVAYGDSFVQACSDVITMCGEATSQYINWYSIRKTRERGIDPPARMGLAVDFAVGRVFDLSPLGFDADKVGQETRKLLGRV